MKKHLLPAMLGLLALFALVPLAFAAGTAAKPAADKSPVAPLAGAITTITGLAISPLVGTGAYGAYKWFTAVGDTPEATAAARAALPWFAQLKFWLPALLIAAAVAAKDTLGTVLPPGTKKPLDVLETVENKISGLVAAGAVVPITMDSLSHMVLGASPAGAHTAALPAGLAMLPVGAMDWSWLLNILTVPFGVAVFAVVWMASHAINVLILLSPWGAVDAALKGARTALLGLLTVAAAVNPWTGALLSLGVILVAWLVAGWSFRLTVFGTVFSWEFFTGKSGRFAPREAGGNAMFSGGVLPGVPVRTYGKLERRAGGAEDGALEFTYRPWLVLAPKTAAVPAEVASRLAIGRGLFFSTVTADTGGTVFVLPPRYRGHEVELARICRFTGGVQPAGLRKAWGVLRELFTGGRAAKAA
jgi:hypothetical protein